MRRAKKYTPPKPITAPTNQLAFNFTVSLEGYEGPLDVLLMLARKQQVDMRAMSITTLASQYLQLIHSAQTLNIELAADYLVMASWLTYLKSRLLLPTPPKLADEPDPQDSAEALRLKLLRLNAIRSAAHQLQTAPQLGSAFFTHGGATHTPHTTTPPQPEATLFDLLAAYTTQRQKRHVMHYTIPTRNVWSLQESRKTLEALLPTLPPRIALHDVVTSHFTAHAPQKDTHSATSSTLNAALELTREGEMQLQQLHAFAEVYIETSRSQ